MIKGFQEVYAGFGGTSLDPPNKNAVLYMGTRTKGLFKSTDFGSSWAKLALPVTTTNNSTGVNIVLIDPVSGSRGTESQIIYAAVSVAGTGSGAVPNLYVSSNGGISFSALAGQPANNLYPHRMALSTTGNLYITYSSSEGPGNGSKGAVWKYSTSTKTWINITPVNETSVGFGGISNDTKVPTTLMLTTHGAFPDRIYRSTNDGATWKNVGEFGVNNVLQDNAEFPWLNWHSAIGGAGHWVDDIEIDPFNSARVMYINGGGMNATYNITSADINNSVTWSPSVRGIEEMGGWGSGRNMVSPPTGTHIFQRLGILVVSAMMI